MRRLLNALRSYLPEFLSARLRGRRFQYSVSQVPPPPESLNAPVRLFIGPANHAAQGYRIARAAEIVPGVRAVSMQPRGDSGFRFPIDNPVPANVYRFSKSWQRAQFQQISQSYSHVIFEAERPLFGNFLNSSVVEEVHALRDRGVSVAMVAYGSDIRIPDRHRTIDEWSPFHEVGWASVPRLRANSEMNRSVLEQVGAPVFVTTPDMLLDWPGASWLPIVVNPDDWVGGAPALERDRPLVVHVPSNPVIKGSDLIEPTMRRLHEEGLIEYQRVQGVPASEMPKLYGDADIVLDQFRIGTYATAAIEALAAERVVIAHLHDQVREHVRLEYKREVPVVQATIASLEEVLRDIVANRDHYRSIAASGPEFVRGLHDGHATAQVLAPFLLGRSAAESSDLR
jgi:hypothetical protein